MKGKYMKLMLLIADFSFQLHFWGMYTKSVYRSEGFETASLAARKLFNELVNYAQGKFDRSFDFSDYAFRPKPYKSSYFTKMGEEVHDVMAGAPKDLEAFCVEFMRIYNSSAYRVRNS